MNLKVSNVINNIPSFKGYNSATYDAPSKNQQTWCIHETAFFRDIDTMEFAKDYITKKFPNGTHIADFACSNGEEAYTLLMLLSEQNGDKKYKVTGYDISKRVLELAESGPFKINYTFTEGFVTQDVLYENYPKKHYRKLFFDSFKKVPKKFLQIWPSSRVEEFLTARIKSENNASKRLKLMCLRQIIKHHDDYTPDNAFILKKKFINGVFDAKLGDIADIEQLVKSDGKTGIVMFKNAWFHIMDSWSRSDINRLNIKGVGDTIVHISRVLPKDGILVVGTLETDHLFNKEKTPIKTIKFNDTEIKTCENTVFHKLLLDSGFVPIFYERVRDILGDFDKSKIFLPSVWKKT